MHGEILSDWRRSGDKLAWSVRIPANTTARVYIPCKPGTAVTENGAPLEKAQGIRVGACEGNFLVCEAPAGTYSFQSACPQLPANA